MHPRNLLKDGVDVEALCVEFPALNRHFRFSKSRALTRQYDFANRDALIAFTDALLRHYFRLAVRFDPTHLVPGVTLRLNTHVTAVSKPDIFKITTNHGDLVADSLVLATGGLSIPKMGATGLAHNIARNFGLRITETRPGLVPLTLAATELPPISGVSQPITARIGKRAFREAMLFTHRGLSGPAILQISSYWRDGQTLAVDLLPDLAPDFLRSRKRAQPRISARTALSDVMPQRLADAFLPADLAQHALADIQDRPLLDLGSKLKTWTITPTGTEAYAKAEVTTGGIDTAELSSQTMETKKIPNLFAIGEAVDVTGWLGGYNFQWAWASGWCAGGAA